MSFRCKLSLLMIAGLILVQLAVNVVFAATFSDEAEFGYKGLLAVRGISKMYQNGGVWYSYMPWAYLIPGSLQNWFGPSLWVGRIFSASCASLSMILVFLTARRIAGSAGAVFSVALAAMCFAGMRFYSLGTSESITALFVIMSFYTLSTDIRRPYKDIISIACSICAFMIRQNMFYGLVMIGLYCVLTQRRFVHMITTGVASVLLMLVVLMPFWPARGILPMQNYIKNRRSVFDYNYHQYPVATLLTSRGCVNNCIFCTTVQVWGKWRARGFLDVVDEMEYLVKEYGVKEFRVVDDAFNVSKRRVEDICNEILKRKLDISWTASAGFVIPQMDESLVPLLAESGLYQIQL